MLMAYIHYLIIAAIFIIFTKVNIEKRIVIKIGRSANTLWVVEWILFTFLASFRKVFEGHGGSDAQNYIDCFLYGYEYSSEKLFYALGRVIRSFTSNYHIYFLFVYGIIVAAILLFAKEILADVDASIPVLFLYFNMYIQSFGVMRQWLAIAIGMIAIVLIKKNKKWCGLILAILAGCIHFTMIAMVAIVLAYYAYTLCKNRLTVGSSFSIPHSKFYLSIIINAITLCVGEILINILSASEYSAYVSKEALDNVSWLGYLPSIVTLGLILYYEKDFIAESLGSLMIFVLFAHFSTVYIMVGLGMFRLFLCFFAFRVWGAAKLRESISKRFILSDTNKSAMKYFVEIIILLDGLLVMWRTLANGGPLPLFLDI